MELSYENSMSQAAIIASIQSLIIQLDTDYCKKASESMFNAASRQEAISVLNPSYPQSKNELIRLQGKALRLLVQYVEALREIDLKKNEVISEQERRKNLNDMFL